jgi:hypothetical protein
MLIKTIFIIISLWNFKVEAASLGAKQVGCLLPESLVSEIASYQPIVNRIIEAAVDGEYSGTSWQRYDD